MTVTVVLSSTTSTSARLDINTSETCDLWEYSTNGGSTYTQFSTTQTDALSYTITGLTPNTTYYVKVRARQKSNRVKVASSSITVRLTGSILEYVYPLKIDEPSPTLMWDWTVKDTNYYHQLTINVNGNTITLSGLQADTVGTNTKFYALSSSLVTSILNKMPSDKSVVATFTLKTYDAAIYTSVHQVGSSTTVEARIETSFDYSAPTITAISYEDTNSVTRAITNDDSILIQNASLLGVTVTMNANNRASLTNLTLQMGDKVVSRSNPMSGTLVGFGEVTDDSSHILDLTLTDSRGYTVLWNVSNIKVIPYQPATLDTWRAARVNSVETTVNLAFTGSISPITINNVRKNSIQSISYLYRKSSSASWEGYGNIPLNDPHLTITDDTFSYDNSSFLTGLSADYSYILQVTVADKLSNGSFTFNINKGKPLVAYRDGKVGINNNEPAYPLDVSGNINATRYVQNSHYLLGVVNVALDSEHLDDVTEEGIYFRRIAPADNKGYPAKLAGMLEVFKGYMSDINNRIYQRYTTQNNRVFSRVYNGSWTDWSEISINKSSLTFEIYGDNVTITRYYFVKNDNQFTLYLVGTFNKSFSVGADISISLNAISTTRVPEYTVSTVGIVKRYHPAAAWVVGEKTSSGTPQTNVGEIRLRPSVSVVADDDFEFFLTWHRDIEWNKE